MSVASSKGLAYSISFWHCIYESHDTVIRSYYQNIHTSVARGCPTYPPPRILFPQKCFLHLFEYLLAQYFIWALVRRAPPIYLLSICTRTKIHTHKHTHTTVNLNVPTHNTHHFIITPPTTRTHTHHHACIWQQDKKRREK